MRISPRQKITGLLTGVLIVSLACAMPYGIGMKQSSSVEQQATEAALIPATDTPTVVPTTTSSPTPTETPQPTATSTLVVPPTATPTAVSGATAAAIIIPGDFVAVTSGVEGGTTPRPRPVAGPANVLVNGDFEAPWPDDQSIATGWTSFDNGKAHQGWYKDTWSKVVFDGKQAQLLEVINDANTGDRFAGIYQTVTVVPGAEYLLTIHGLLRSNEGSEGVSGHGYAMQYAIDLKGGKDWQTITQWIDLPFPEHPRTDPYAKNVYTYGTYSANVIPSSKTLTLYLRGVKKWADPNEGNFDWDALSLAGTGVVVSPTVAPVITSTSAPVPLTTPTAILTPQLPPSGGEIEPDAPSPLLYAISGLVVLLLMIGAVVGFFKRRA